MPIRLMFLGLPWSIVLMNLDSVFEVTTFVLVPSNAWMNEVLVMLCLDSHG
jgi:hypothetical protein